MAAYLVAVVGALVIVIPVVIAFSGLIRAFQLNDPLTLAIMALTLVVVGGIVIFSALRGALRHRRDATEQRAQAVEGFVTRESESVGDTIAYYYVINGMRLAVTSPGYVALIEGLPYRVYYSPRSMMVLSIEPLRPLARAPW